MEISSLKLKRVAKFHTEKEASKIMTIFAGSAGMLSRNGPNFNYSLGPTHEKILTSLNPKAILTTWTICTIIV